MKYQKTEKNFIDTHKVTIKKFFKRVFHSIRHNKKMFIVFLSFEAIFTVVLIQNILAKQSENAFNAILAMLLLFIPSLLEAGLYVRIPKTLQIIAFVFVFFAEILGEILDFYQSFPIWDTILHSCNGFIFAAFGFCIIDVITQTKNARYSLSPIYLTLFAFCFAMTIGVLWEFFEFGGDMTLGKDMQKDTFVTAIHSVALPEDENVTRIADVTHITNIQSTTITYKDAAGNLQTYTIENGYLDIGIIDTLKDLIVNTIGALAFCIIGYIYMKLRKIPDKNKNQKDIQRMQRVASVVSHFIPEYEGNSDSTDNTIDIR